MLLDVDDHYLRHCLKQCTRNPKIIIDIEDKSALEVWHASQIQQATCLL